MNPAARRIQTIYLTLLFLSTLAASLIWGVNTLFLLSAGLSNTEAFLANAFFTIGQVIFEVPTGVVADVKGRRTSYLLGTLTLALSTLLYLLAWWLQADMWLWAVSSVFLGLGFTFFSGATEAWLVDALESTKFKGSVDAVFGKGQSVSGAAMLIGSVGGGLLAQATNLGVPYVLRAAILLLTFGVAFVFMKDQGFTPSKSAHPLQEVKKVLSTSMQFGWHNPAVRWMMLAGPFVSGVGFYAFYAMQPYLLELYGNPHAYSVAGLAAAIVAGAQVVGGLLVPQVRRVFKRRTSVLLASVVLNLLLLSALGMVTNFWFAIVLLCGWGLLSSATQPVRQAYMNGQIPSKQRATVLSFDSLFGSSGGVVIQPVLGKIADINSYGQSFVAGAVIQAVAAPFILLSRKQKSKSDDLLA